MDGRRGHIVSELRWPPSNTTLRRNDSRQTQYKIQNTRYYRENRVSTAELLARAPRRPHSETGIGLVANTTTRVCQSSRRVRKKVDGTDSRIQRTVLETTSIVLVYAPGSGMCGIVSLFLDEMSQGRPAMSRESSLGHLNIVIFVTFVSVHLNLDLSVLIAVSLLFVFPYIVIVHLIIHTERFI